MKTTLRLIIAAFVLAAVSYSTVMVQAEDYTYTTNGGAITITGYTGPGGAVTIPSMINGLPVSSIWEWAFGGCTSLTSVTIVTNVTSIGWGAFSSCTSLTNVTMGNSVTTIEDYAFGSCYGLTCMRIPNSVTNIEGSPFWNCSSLTAIHVEPQITTYSSLDGVLFNKNQTTLITFPTDKTGDYAVPTTVTTIGNEAFGMVSLTNVTFPESVNYIGRLAFLYCHVTAANFQGDCPTLHPNAFTCADMILYYLPGTAGWSPRHRRKICTAVAPAKRYDLALWPQLWPPNQRVRFHHLLGYQRPRRGGSRHKRSQSNVDSGEHEHPNGRLVLFQRCRVDELSLSVLPHPVAVRCGGL